jgi:hypothetical protein
MPTASKPSKLTIRAYHVGFGDCFLLTFDYPKEKKHVLIDFGTTGTPSHNDKTVLSQVADLIVKQCKDGKASAKLDAIVLTHRHRDHIRGFSTDRGDGNAGSRIADLKPDLVVQPWTEDPSADRNFKGPASISSTGKKGFTYPNLTYLSSLSNMNNFALSLVGGEIQRLQRLRSVKGSQELAFVGMDNLSNESAVKNLIQMGKKAKLKPDYLYYGAPTKLEQVLPGVKVRVLGPPTITQHAKVQKETSTSPEFWMLQSNFWLGQSRMLSVGKGARRVTRRADIPLSARWFVGRCDDARTSQLLSLVRIIDDAMNNTSVILLFQVGSKKFLFPGDAQIENWEYALNDAPDAAANRELLKGVTVYKVGHHGSRNATPKTLYKLMVQERGHSAGELTSMISTMPGKHGKEANRSEVPRKPLVQALKQHSHYITTEKASNKQPYVESEFPL